MDRNDRSVRQENVRSNKRHSCDPGYPGVPHFRDVLAAGDIFGLSYQSGQCESHCHCCHLRPPPPLETLLSPPESFFCNSLVQVLSLVSPDVNFVCHITVSLLLYPEEFFTFLPLFRILALPLALITCVVCCRTVSASASMCTSHIFSLVQIPAPGLAKTCVLCHIYSGVCFCIFTEK